MRFWNYLVIMVGLGVLFSIAGIDIIGFTALLQLFNLIPGDASSGGVAQVVILGLLAGATVAGIAIGFVTKSQSENYVIIPAILLVGSIFISIGYSIINAAFDFAPWIGYIVTILFAPLIVGFIMSLVDYFRGID